MSQNASFIPPNVTPPDPPEAKAVALVFSIFMSVIMISVVGLVCIDFIAEMAGFPLFSKIQPTPQDISPFAEEETMETIKSPFELITPKHETLMIGPEIVVIYTRRLPDGFPDPPELLLDNTPHPWEEQFGNNTWFARLQLQVGQHHVQVEESEAGFFVENPDSSLRAPLRWTWNRPHPDTDKTDRCSDCHERGESADPLTMNSNQAIGNWKGSASCFACHDKEEHAILHAIIQPAMQKCLRCHTVH